MKNGGSVKKTKKAKSKKPVKKLKPKPAPRKNPKDQHTWVEKPGGWSCEFCGTYKADPESTGESWPIYYPPGGAQAVFRPIPPCKKEAA
jgi:hypothetical protein